MVVKCPKYRNPVPQGNLYEKLLASAESSNLECYGAVCDLTWKPSAAEQALMAANLRKLVLPSTSETEKV